MAAAAQVAAAAAGIEFQLMQLTWFSRPRESQAAIVDFQSTIGHGISHSWISKPLSALQIEELKP